MLHEWSGIVKQVREQNSIDDTALSGGLDLLVNGGGSHLRGGGPGGAALTLQSHRAQCIALVLQHERIGVLVSKLGEGVVDVAVVALVREHALEGVHPLGVLGQLPVGDGDLRGGEVLPALVQLSAGAQHLLDDRRVGVAGCIKNNGGNNQQC